MQLRLLVPSALLLSLLFACTQPGNGAQLHTLTVNKTGLGTVTSTPAGIACGSDCQESYAAGTAVTLTATPDSGATFTGWGGDCSGSSACTVAMNSDKAVSATFSQGNGETCTYGNETLDDDLIVPAGVTCTLNGTTVQGNIQLGNAANLTASTIAVDGNIQAEAGGSSVTVSDSSVDGDIQVKQGVSADVRRTFIGGNLQLESNSGSLDAEGNTIDGDLQAFQNTGGVTITGNTIDGNLQCQGNDPAPTGGNNTVGGNKEGQCSAL